MHFFFLTHQFRSTLAGFEQVSKRYMSRNSQCRSIVNVISTALTAETEADYNTTVQDWSPTEKCPFCDGLRLSTDDCSEKDSMRIEHENESAASDGEYYGAGCSNQVKMEQNAANSSPESTGHLESSGGSQSRLFYMHPFSNLCTPSVLPVMTPFVPLPEIANQLFCQSLLQWSTSSLLLQQMNSHRSPENLHNSISEQYLSASKRNIIMQGKENGDTETNHLIQHMIPSISAKAENVIRAAHICSNNNLPALHAGLSKSSFGNESLLERPRALFYKEGGNNSNGMIEEDQPLDLSSRRALQAATQCAVSSAHNSRDGRRLRALINAISDKSPNSLSKDEENNSAISQAKNIIGTRTLHSSMSKRNYTQADLDAAVRDIRCGRLGTRRASVVYGIPRSTLRNKIYKLDAAEDQRTNGTGGKKKRINNFGTMLTPNRAQSPPATTVPFPNDANAGSTEIILPPKQTLVAIDGVSVPEIIQETGPNNKPHFANQESINANDEPVMENKKSLWSPFVHRQTAEPKSVHAGEKKTGRSPTNTTENQLDWKKSRPKRGQYRKYKKDALDEAVRSVRRGEMSVHRAGSFYGVPHSTLEYKVKERNLTRTKCKKTAAENIFETTKSGHRTNSSYIESSPLKNSPQQLPLPNPKMNDIGAAPAMRAVVLTSATSAVPS
ncbi:helix-turn-helix, Psq domain containing protein [Brugia malayi]|uniref:Helix-turn-helix, Psq domain containing protein n=1 Tax=Brugia malayi TaxID=6279 RepID=A0A4E9EP97_BRUMA|nr:helix-turn-helix, Psq domain containing protein [Brugia malayi]VIO86053.1 helix-turn-helix, Psq domain containing protein [Brugia malayi]